MSRWLIIVALGVVSGCSADLEVSRVLSMAHPVSSSDMDPANVVFVPQTDRLRAASESLGISLWARRENAENVALLAHDYPAVFFGFHGAQFKWEVRYANGRGASCYADPAFVAELDRWYHMAATFNGYVVRLFVDGEEICTNLTRGGALALSDAPWTIGGYETKEGEIIDLLVGDIVSLEVFDAVPSSAQLRAMAEAVPEQVAADRAARR